MTKLAVNLVFLGGSNILHLHFLMKMEKVQNLLGERCLIIILYFLHKNLHVVRIV